jgi:NAD(P)-dependent dehydrogenase (short-subunit alcohol dehydrogenase family)
MTQQIAIVTGGSRGLGRSTVLHLADHGVDSIFTYRSGSQQAEEVVRAVAAKGRRAVAIALDVDDSANFPAFVAAVRAQLREIWKRDTFDFLVNNAGHGQWAPFTDTTEAQFDALVRVHLKAPFFLSQQLLPLMADGGRILNVSTGLARFTFPGYAAYAAVKGGVEVLTRYMAKELGARRITVNTLAPGAIETDFGGGAVRDNADLNRLIADQTALGRVGQPDDIGNAVALLLSPEAAWINGVRLEVSGGQSL